MKRLLNYIEDEYHQKWLNKSAHTLWHHGSHSQAIVCYSVIVCTSQPSRPSLKVHMTNIAFLRSINFSWTKIFVMLGICRSTLYRIKVNETGLMHNLRFVSYEELLQTLKQQYPQAGEQLLLGMLHGMGILCTLEMLRQVVHDIDPINCSLRWNTKLHRRTYSVPGPNSLCHIGKVPVILFHWLLYFFFTCR